MYNNNNNIFIYVRRFGPFLGVQNLEFQYFWGGSEDFVDISLQNWNGFRGHFYAFQGQCAGWGYFGGSPKLQIFLGV